ncbi:MULTISPECIES: S-adenosylmethionine:tRNA ribosyltransferase-isomerase [Streptomyces]|uniref:S-adenosylmethionine:tRNA ribosyltransferase-isomerase n=1 Tax=Streptomyces TaxID=1883 RepID=UPI0019093E79|nr:MULTISPECIES: S-adenosylmethionine:tRNA ribosyltransferase-isomerase [unclassified Streptomyces]MBK3383907.1 S-adenosylmethionine:tRNA ribosyltransferase-isomerase [Streptomyces sp. DEF147AK]MBV7253545.1 S-adenosylmethionine:tRNA ribosyltransferase-isomerase [Streptomyces sp. S-2]
MSARAVVGRVPGELSARVPVEEREPGRGRDGVRLLVSAGEREPRVGWFTELPGLLRAGDLLVVNTSATLPAAADGRLGGEPVVVHFSTRADGAGPGERWAVELRSPDGRGTTWPRPGGPAGAVVALADGARLELVEPLAPGAERLWWARAGEFGAADGSGSAVVAWLRRHGRPIRYAYTERDQPLAAYRTVFAAAGEDGGGSAEMPSAGRPFTARTVTELVRAGVQFAPVTLHTGVASAEAHEPPYPERYAVSPHAAWLVNAVRAGGGRVIAVGTTAVRALESAVGPDGRVRAASGWTGLVVTPERGVRVVDGLLTGLHEPEASHLLMLEAVAGAAAVERGYAAAVRARLLWHEFGDVHLLTRRG